MATLEGLTDKQIGFLHALSEPGKRLIGQVLAFGEQKSVPDVIELFERGLVERTKTGARLTDAGSRLVLALPPRRRAR